VRNYGILGPAKCAMDHMVCQLGCELAPQGFRINCVASSTVGTEWITNHPQAEKLKRNLLKATPFGRLGTEEDIARAVSLLTSPDADFIIGQTIPVDGGMSLLL